MEFSLSSPFILSVVLISTIFLTFLMIHLGPRLGLVDYPNFRSSHDRPLPRAGGLAVAIAFFGGLAILWLFKDLSMNWVLPLLIGGGLLVGVGLIDDLKGLSAKTRLLVQFLAACVTLLLLDAFSSTEVTISLLPWAPPLLAYVFCILYVMWHTNLYNFMDGIDGLAGTQAVVVSVLSASVCALQGNWPLFHLYGLVAVIALGFLIFNWAPARIFMGDSGAYLFGFLFASLSLMSKIYSDSSLFCHLILLGAFISDATYTLVIRLFSGKSPHIGHREHGFQHAIRKGYTHSKVTLFLNFITLLWLSPLALASLKYPNYSLLFLVIAYAPLMGMMIYLRAGLDLETTDEALPTAIQGYPETQPTNPVAIDGFFNANQDANPAINPEPCADQIG